MANADTADAVLTVDLAAIAANYRTMAAQLNGAACAAVVKADAYGLGATPVVRTLYAAGCRHFFVATLDEGIAVRAALPPQADVPIYLLRGPVRGAEAVVDRERLTPVLFSVPHILEWSAHAKAHGGRRAVIEIDSGMARLGLTQAEIEILSKDPKILDGIEIDFIMSHLACADEPDHPINARQLEAFEAALGNLPDAKASLANSAGVFLGPDYHYDLVRVGAALFGIAVCPKSHGHLSQVVRLKGKILQVRDVDSDMTVGYGATARSRRGSRLATVAVGYADGYLRSLSNRSTGYIANKKVPLVGRVSMDLATFDVSDLPPEDVRPNDFIELIGPHYGVDDLAKDAGTIGYEILTALGSRYRRLYIGGDTI